MLFRSRLKPIEGAVEGWYVYVNLIIGRGLYLPFYVGLSDKPYEFRRYSSRPKDWTAIARLNNNRFHTVVLVDSIPNYKTASMMYRLVVNYYHRRGNIIINDRVELKSTPSIDYNKDIKFHLEKLIKEYSIPAKINGHSMTIDMSKRNYHPKFLSTNDQ